MKNEKYKINKAQACMLNSQLWVISWVFFEFMSTDLKLLVPDSYRPVCWIVQGIVLIY